jgi:hypothetical protein
MHKYTDNGPPNHTIAKAVQINSECPSDWHAWTTTGQYLYLRFRWGTGTADAYPDNRHELWERVPDGQDGYFEDDDKYASAISLQEFCHRAELTIAPDAELIGCHWEQEG